MSKTLDKLALLTAKRAGILADLFGTEREIEQLCRNVATESVSNTDETLQPQKKRGRKAKSASLENCTDSGPASERPQISPDIHEKKVRNDRQTLPDGGLTAKTVVNNLRDSEEGAVAPSGVPDSGAEPEPAPRRRGRPPKAATSDASAPGGVMEVTSLMNDLLQSMEPGLEMTFEDVGSVGYKNMVCGDPSQPSVNRWLNSALHALAAAGHVTITVSSSGSHYTRVGG